MMQCYCGDWVLFHGDRTVFFTTTLCGGKCVMCTTCNKFHTKPTIRDIFRRVFGW